MVELFAYLLLRLFPFLHLRVDYSLRDELCRMVDAKIDNGLELESPPDSIHKICPSSPDSSKAEKALVLDDKSVWRKVDRRLLPMLAVMYLFSFMDRGVHRLPIPR